MATRYILYLVRWQLSTPLLAFCVIYFASLGDFWSTVIANFIGGLIFFWIDRYIFTKQFNKPIWQVKSKATCIDCGRTGRGYRLVKAKDYDRTNDTDPEFRCEECSEKKASAIEENGIRLD